MTWTIRPYRDGDAAICGEIYYDAIHNGTAPHYSAAQARAWAPSADASEWDVRLAERQTWLAVRDTSVSGFLTLRSDGHLDLFFVRPAARKDGVAGALYDAMVQYAKAQGLRRLTAHASLLARSFLARRGWTVTAEELAERNGEKLLRFEMVLENLAP